ncbi:Abortive infection bacteriophage resistance protein [Fodinibius roseus]|uniref:Abortive infection bacteriophage resistance protein n=1 Tax=Fodinibius roseus TaxID=1194090 RepID=A0A1M5EAY9_9BACT|nr:Abi family protein [Fodinibius roseus]SHF76399.1 Abortive infection bacteriophage resistance protein [Fodinibius roseus]
MQFTKSPLSIADQVDLLKDRGLTIDDEERAHHYLSYISFYRLRAYTYPFQDNDDSDHPFTDDVSFNDILDYYIFDRRLRLIVFDAIERIEIAFRTQMINQCALVHGSHWYENSSFYRNREHFENDLDAIDDELERSAEVFIDHYNSKYDKPERPPAWMTLEIISLGTLSKLYHNLKLDKTKKTISGKFNLGHPFVLESWMHAISNVRNICAHHSRLWNRKLVVAPKMPKFTSLPFINKKDIDVHKPYAILCCMAYLMDVINPGHHFKQRLFDLFEEFNQIELKYMGFPKYWRNEALWQI